MDSDSESDIDLEVSDHSDEENEDLLPLLYPEVELEVDNVERESDPDDDEYEDMPVLAPEVGPLAGQPPVTYRSVDGTVWSTMQPNIALRAGQHNVFRPNGPEGVKPVVTEEMTKGEIFKFLFTETIVGGIVRWTNLYAASCVARHNQENPDRLLVWKETNPSEIYAFIAILISAGVDRSKKEPVLLLWTTNPMLRRPFYPATMSRNRFTTLMRYLRFDNVEQRHIGRQRVPVVPDDRAAPVREMVTFFNRQLPRLFEPSMCLTVDEMLVKFRGRCKFRVYMKSKPGRYGLKIWTNVDSASSYVLALQLYTGKEAQRELQQGRRVVLDLVEHYERTGRNITTDNFFSSLALAKDLIARQLSFLGTVRKNRREVPRELKPKRGRAEYSSNFVFHEKATLVSYKPAKNKDTVILLSTFHENATVDQERPDRKPHMILDYNRTKGGVDKADQMVAEYSCQRPTDRWPMKIFFTLLDVAALNAYILWTKKHPNWMSTTKHRRILFLRDLATEIAWSHIQNRARLSHLLHNHIKTAMKDVCKGTNRVLPFFRPPTPPPASARQRCHACGKTSRNRCSRCNFFICSTHKVVTVNCAPNICRHIE